MTSKRTSSRIAMMREVGWKKGYAPEVLEWRINYIETLYVS